MTQVSDNQQAGQAQQAGAVPGPQQGWQPYPGQVLPMAPPYWQHPQQPAGMVPQQYPYPMVQPYPYPVPQAAPQTTNATAVFALIMSLLWLFGIGSLVGLLAGNAARQECAEKRQSGDGVAVVAMILGGIGLFFTVLAIVV